MSLMSTLKAGALAVALGASALVAVPAQAAPPSFGFSFNFGNGGGGGPGVYFNFNGNPKYVCLSDKQIFWQLQSYGFKKIQIVKSKGYYVIAVARYQGDWWQIAINRCTGKIKKAPLYGYNGYGNNYGNGITLQFGF